KPAELGDGAHAPAPLPLTSPHQPFKLLLRHATPTPPTTPRPAAAQFARRHPEDRAGSHTFAGYASPEPVSAHAQIPGAPSPPSRFVADSSAVRGRSP